MNDKIKNLLLKYKYESLIIFISVFFYLALPVLFNYVDGIVNGTTYITALYPHYPLLYPLIVKVSMFFLGSFCVAFKFLKFVQILICCCILIYTVRSVPYNRKKLMTFLLLGYTPILVFQCNVISESIFISTEILLIATIIRWISSNSFLNKVLHIIAAIVLVYTKHTGLLFLGILPLYFLIMYIKSKGVEYIYSIFKISFVYVLIFATFIMMNWFASELLKTTKVPLYGRPTMHIITETYRQLNEKQKKILRDDWSAKAKDKEDIQLQNFILNSDDIWMGPRTEFSDMITKKYSNWSESEVFDYVEIRLNENYWTYLFSGNIYVYKYFVFNFIELFPFYANAIKKLAISNDFLFDSGLNNGSFYNCNFNDSFKKDSFWILKGPLLIAERLSNLFYFLFFIWFFLFYKEVKKIGALEISLIVFIVVNTLVLTIFTTPLPRYSIPNFIVLLFIVMVLFPENYHLSNWRIRKK